MIVYFQYEKARLERKRIVEMSKGVGKPKVGGPFVLKDLDGNVFTEEGLKGKYNFVCADLYLGGGMLADRVIGLFWLHALPRYLPRRAGQNGRHHRQGAREVWREAGHASGLYYL